MGPSIQQVQKIIIAILLFPIWIYRFIVSPWLGNRCRFFPSCSVYAEQALKEKGLTGLWYVAKRLVCCHPFHAGGYDPVPNSKTTSTHDRP